MVHKKEKGFARAQKKGSELQEIHGEQLSKNVGH